MGRTAVIAGTATAVSNKVSQKQYANAAEKAQAEAQEQAAAAPPPAAAPAPAAGGLTPDVVEQLKQLGQLKDQGILTEEEFVAQKAKLLGG
jgi:hypothetical protein